MTKWRLTVVSIHIFLHDGISVIHCASQALLLHMLSYAGQQSFREHVDQTLHYHDCYYTCLLQFQLDKHKNLGHNEPE